MSTSAEPNLPIRRASKLAFAAALLWLIAAGITMGLAVQTGFRIVPFDVITIATLAAGIAAPAAALLLLALVLQGGNRAEIKALAARYAQAGAHAGNIRTSLTDIDGMLASVNARLEALRGQVGDGSDTLGGHATRLEASANGLATAAQVAQGATDQLLGTLPKAQEQVAAIGTLLAGTGIDAARQLGDVETLLAGLWSRNDDALRQAEAATGNITALLTGIDSAANRTEQSIAERRQQLEASVESLFDHTTAALDTTRDGVHAHTNALLASVEQARVALDHIGGEAARAIGKRLERLLTASDQFAAQLGEQDARSRLLVDTIERSFVMLDGKLQHSATMGQTTLDDLTARIGGLRNALDAMATPIGSTQGAIQTLTTEVAGLGLAADAAVTTLGTTLPAHYDELASLSAALDNLTSNTNALSTPVTKGRETIEAAAASLSQQREAIETGATQLAGQLDTARATLAAIEAQAQGTTLSATQALIETLGRVREVADSSTGQMRATIAGLVAEAESALERAGTDKVELAFGGPVRSQIAAIEAASLTAAAAAQAAADQVTQRLLGLTQTVALVESRIDAAQAKFDAGSQADLATRSTALIEMLGSAAVDVSKRLDLDIADSAWAAYLRGDRSIFARRAVKLLDRGSAARIAKLYATDAGVREAITHYVSTFEVMLKRVLSEPDGKTLAVTLVSSDIGKLYVALAQAVERLG